MISRDPRLQLLLAVVRPDQVTIAADPVLVLGPALARHFGLPEIWAGYYLSALGGGTIVASFVPMPPPSRVQHQAYPLSSLERPSLCSRSASTHGCRWPQHLWRGLLPVSRDPLPELCCGPSSQRSRDDPP